MGVWEIGGAVVVVAIVYVLVRPSSKGAELVTAMGDLFTATVTAVTVGTNKVKGA